MKRGHWPVLGHHRRSKSAPIVGEARGNPSFLVTTFPPLDLSRSFLGPPSVARRESVEDRKLGLEHKNADLLYVDPDGDPSSQN